MKLNKLLFPILFILVIGCSTDDSTSKTTATTRLELTTLDENDVAIENVEVKLYTSQTDYDNDTNIVETLITDVNGKVTFDNLLPITYFWKTTTDCHLENAVYNTIDPIINNTLNSFSTNLTSNFIGEISIFNNTVYDYTLSFTGPINLNVNLSPNTFYAFTDYPSGTYTFNITPDSGPNSSITQTEVLECGGSIYIEIN